MNSSAVHFPILQVYPGQSRSHAVTPAPKRSLKDTWGDGRQRPVDRYHAHQSGSAVSGAVKRSPATIRIVRTSVAQRVPVYRQQQATMTSPCILGNLCPGCAKQAHCHITGYPCRSCRRGGFHACERATVAEPAFFVTFQYALGLVWNGLARFVNRNTALQLTFSDLVPLRDQSCKVDEHVIVLYTAGSSRARLAVDFGWSVPPSAIEKSYPHMPVFPFV